MKGDMLHQFQLQRDVSDYPSVWWWHHKAMNPASTVKLWNGVDLKARKFTSFRSDRRGSISLMKIPPKSPGIVFAGSKTVMSLQLQ